MSFFGDLLNFIKKNVFLVTIILIMGFFTGLLLIFISGIFLIFLINYYKEDEYMKKIKIQSQKGKRLYKSVQEYAAEK